MSTCLVLPITASSSSSLKRGRRRRCYSGTKTRPQSSLPLTMMKMAQTSIPSRWPTELQYFCGAGLLVPTPGTHNSIFSHSWRKGRLSVACHVEGPPDRHGRLSAQSLANGWASHQLNLHERLVQLNLQERLRAPDLRVLHSPHLRRGVYGGSPYLRGRPGALADVCGGLCGILLWCLSLRARAKWRS